MDGTGDKHLDQHLSTTATGQPVSTSDSNPNSSSSINALADANTSTNTNINAQINATRSARNRKDNSTSETSIQPPPTLRRSARLSIPGSSSENTDTVPTFTKQKGGTDSSGQGVKANRSTASSDPTDSTTAVSGKRK